MSVPHWDDDPESWDNVFLAGEVLPGLNRIESLKTGKRKMDIKPAPGRDGASYVDQGYEPATFTICIDAYFTQEVSGLEDFLERLRPRKDSPLQAYPVSHPLLTMSKIDTLYILDIQIEKKPGLVTAKLSCTEFTPLTVKASGAVKKKASSIEDSFAAANPTSVVGRLTGSFALERSLPSKTTKPPKP